MSEACGNLTNSGALTPTKSVFWGGLDGPTATLQRKGKWSVETCFPPGPKTKYLLRAAVVIVIVIWIEDD